jgi:hypothetical protein
VCVDFNERAIVGMRMESNSWGNSKCQKVAPVPMEHFGGHEQREVDHEEELDLKLVHLYDRNASDLGVVGIGAEGVVKELGGCHHCGDEEPVYVERRDAELPVRLKEPVDVYERQHKALFAAVRVLDDPFQVIVYVDGWGA